MRTYFAKLNLTRLNSVFLLFNLTQINSILRIYVKEEMFARGQFHKFLKFFAKAY